ncbi:hypothetical protein A11A3_00500 [Alcanivorax hongdengensis A-11-3]|uniref:Uncharacterized protein n=1 Tax=Alcanivorax hongdengensis A-11-3 TaxID=1177179 RepID=L0WGG5_9GAMM|nr:hypothetical protein [Alcanivorax hongdengensis]EKF75928.1 hypothetical protein A11A3_00500 [Alcanivorax hongdengensis A-11-3]
MRLLLASLLLAASLLFCPIVLANAQADSDEPPASVAERELTVKHYLLLCPLAVMVVTGALVIWTRRKRG